MCGIHFVVNNGNHNRSLSQFMKDGFLTNQVRGLDSTGVFQIKNSYSATHKGVRDVDIFKRAVTGSEFLSKFQVVDAIINGAAWQRATIGHVRAATAGAKDKDENAHPFLATRGDGSRIVGVHNGSLTNWRSKKDADKFEVDSAWLFSKLAQDGAEAFKNFNGAFALVWYDSKHPNRLFVARNKERPLFWAWTQDRKGMIACSELGMLGWLAQRNSVGLWSDSKGFRFFQPEAGSIYSIDLNNPSEYIKVGFDSYDPNSTMYDDPKPAVQVVGVPAQKANPTVTPTGGQSTTKTTTSRGNDWSDIRENQMLNAMKAALGQARFNRTELGQERLAEKSVDPYIDNDQLEMQLDKEIQAHLKTKHGMSNPSPNPFVTSDSTRVVFQKDPVARSASESEIKAAKDANVFGMIVNMYGYWYDSDDATLLAGFNILEGNKEIDYDAIVRGKSSVAAQSYITDRMVPMVVIGIATYNNNKYFVLADFVQQGRKVHIKYADSPTYMTRNLDEATQSTSRMLH